MQHSATGLERVLCERYYAWWNWGKDLGVEREPKSNSLTLGIELHDISEKYLKFGTQPDRLTQAGSMFLSGLPFLPPPKTGGVEGEFVLTVDGHAYGGKLDYMGMLYDNFAPIGPGLLDHKTSKSPKRYMLQGKRNQGEGYHETKGFLDNIQAVIYAAQYLVRQNVDSVRLRWLYYKSVGAPMAIPSDIVVTREEIEEAFGRLVHPLAEKSAALSAVKAHPLTLAANPDRCHIYGRDCHYKPQCALTLKDHLRHNLAPKNKELLIMTESMLDKARAKKLAAAGGSPAPVATLVAAPAPKADIVNPPEARPVVVSQTAVTVPAPAIEIEPRKARIVSSDEFVASEQESPDAYAMLDACISLGARKQAFAALKAVLKAAL